MNRRSLSRDSLILCLIALAYFYSREFSFLYPASKRAVMAVWPVSGIGLAAFLIAPRRLWQVITGTLLAVGCASNLLHGRIFFASLGFAVADVIESLTCAGLITLWCGRGVTFSRVKEVATLVVTAIFVTSGTACIAAGTAVLAGVSSFGSFWQSWWISGALGNLVVGPLLVTWLRTVDPRRTIRWKRVLEAGLYAVFLLVVIMLSFQTNVPAAVLTPRPFMFIAFVAWGAVRFGSRAVSFALTLFACIALCSEAVIAGPLSIWGGDTATERLLLLQVFMGFTAAFGYLLAAVYAEAEQARLASLESETRLAFALDASQTGIWDLSLRDYTTRRSLIHDRIFGYDTAQADWTLDTVLEHVLPEDREALKGRIQQAAESGVAQANEFRIRRADGSDRWVLIAGSIHTDGVDGERRMIGIIRDITEHKEVESDLRRRTQQLAQLAAELTLVEHRERFRLAEILHDHLQQLLVGARMQTELVRPELKSEEHRKHLELASRTLTEALDLTRKITTEMSPPILFQDKLPAALEWLGSEMGPKHNLEIVVHAEEGEDDIPEVVAALLFNAAEELLLNVSKHSRAHSASVSLRFKGEKIELEVRDEGVGFAPATVPLRNGMPHFGLFSIRERVEALGGEVKLSSAPGHGTQVVLTLPLKMP
jgi:PAS domain S-box-containing protein